MLLNILLYRVVHCCYVIRNTLCLNLSGGRSILKQISCLPEKVLQLLNIDIYSVHFHYPLLFFHRTAGKSPAYPA